MGNSERDSWLVRESTRDSQDEQDRREHQNAVLRKKGEMFKSGGYEVAYFSTDSLQSMAAHAAFIEDLVVRGQDYHTFVLEGVHHVYTKPENPANEVRQEVEEALK